MRVLGVDPGIATTGFAVLQRTVARPEALDIGVWRTSPARAHPGRLAELHDQVEAALARWHPEAIAVERLFFNSNARTAMAVGQASGVVLALAARRGIPVTDYTPPEVKLSVAGTGTATKQQVQKMVAALLRLSAVPSPPDAADACALALCHLNRAGLRRAVLAAGGPG